MGDLLEFLLVAVPIAGVLGGGYFLVRGKFNQLRLALAEERGSNKTAQIATEKMALEERVRVLERIVTDKGYGIAEEIEALRDSDSGVPLALDKKERA